MLVDSHSGWPDTLFLPNAASGNVPKGLTYDIAKIAKPKKFRTDLGTVFKSETFEKFCKENFIEHIIYPVRDHRENGSVERKIRTINERLRTDKGKTSKQVAFKYTICTKNGKEARWKGKYNTSKSKMIERCLLHPDPRNAIEPKDFSEEAVSNILVRESKRNKIEGAFKKVKGRIVSEFNTTITVLPKTIKCTVYSKRDVNADVNMPLSSKSAKSNKVASGEKNKIETKADRCKKKRTAADLEMGFSPIHWSNQ